MHDLPDDARRREAGQSRQVDRGLGVAGPGQHTALLGSQRQHVAGLDELERLGRGVGEHPAGARAIGGRDAGGDAVAGVDGDRVRRAHALTIVRRHQRDAEPVERVAGDRCADVAAGVPHQEAHQLGRGLAGREDEVALVLAVLVVDHDDGLAFADVGDGAFDAVESDCHDGPSF